MPSEKILLQKQEAVAALAEKLKGSIAGVLVDYKGITVAADTKLRKELREAGVDYFVVKNSLLSRAAATASLNGLDPVLKDSTAIALSENNAVVAAKILSKYADGSKGKFKVKAGFVEGHVIDAKGVDQLAKLPSREELVAQVLRGFNAPISGLVNVLNGNIRGLAIVLDRIREQKSA